MTTTQEVKPYRDFSDFLKEHFARKMQKISVNAGFGCPNRDGTIGTGGCIYCNNSSFTPAYAFDFQSIHQQLEEGKAFFRKKYPDMGFLAYFQSYTNTHGDLNRLMRTYTKALEHDDIEGLIIATRPDCMPETLLQSLRKLAETTFVMIEFGAESSHDTTLAAVNRCHSWADTQSAVIRTKQAGIHVGLHFINGLPGETPEMILQTVDRINQLPVDVVKFHQLQVIRNTTLHKGLERGEYNIIRWTAEEYIELCAHIIDKLRSDIAIERFVSQSPDELLVYPKWGLKNYQFTNMLLKKLGTSRK